MKNPYPLKHWMGFCKHNDSVFGMAVLYKHRRDNYRNVKSEKLNFRQKDGSYGDVHHKDRYDGWDDVDYYRDDYSSLKLTLTIWVRNKFAVLLHINDITAIQENEDTNMFFIPKSTMLKSDWEAIPKGHLKLFGDTTLEDVEELMLLAKL